MISSNLTGRLGADAELKETQQGRKYIICRIATNGTKKDKTTWVTVRYFTDNAENLVKYLTKGKLVNVQGSLEASAYISKKDNTPVASIDINAYAIEFISVGKGGEQQEEVNPDEADCGTLKKPEEIKKIAEELLTTVSASASSSQPSDDDDLPF